MAEILILILQMLATAGLLLVAVLVAAILSQIADPAPEYSSLQLDLSGPTPTLQESAGGALRSSLSELPARQ